MALYNSKSVNYETTSEKFILSSKKISTQLEQINFQCKVKGYLKASKDCVIVAKEVEKLVICVSECVASLGNFEEKNEMKNEALFDQSQFKNSLNLIKDEELKLVNPDSSKRDILDAAGKLAKCTTALSNSCKSISNEPKISMGDKQEFLNFAKMITSTTIGLVTGIKKLSANQNNESRSECGKSCQELISHVQKLCTFVELPQFGGNSYSLPPARMALIQQILTDTSLFTTNITEFFSLIKTQCAQSDNSAASEILPSYLSLLRSIENLGVLVQDSAPGRVECKNAIDNVLNSIKKDAEEATTTEPMMANNVANRFSLVGELNSFDQMAISMLDKAPKTKLKHMSNNFTNWSNATKHLIEASYEAAHHMPSNQGQKAIIKNANIIAEKTVSILSKFKDLSLDPDAIVEADDFNNEMLNLHSIVSKMTALLTDANNDIAQLREYVESIENQIDNLEDFIPSKIIQSFNSAMQDIDEKGQLIVKCVSDIIIEQKSIEEYVACSKYVSDLFSDITRKMGYAIKACTEESYKKGLRKIYASLGQNVLFFSKSILENAKKPDAAKLMNDDVLEAGRQISDTLATLANISKDGSKGIIKLDQGISQLNGFMKDLEEQVKLANAGILKTIQIGDTFSSFSDKLFLDIQNQKESADKLYTFQSMNQTLLLHLVSEIMEVNESLVENSKRAAASLKSTEKFLQTQLIGACKNYVSSLQASFISLSQVFGAEKDEEKLDLHESHVAETLVALREFERITRLISEEGRKGPKAMIEAKATLNMLIGTVDTFLVDFPVPFEEAITCTKQFSASVSKVIKTEIESGDSIVSACSIIKKQYEKIISASLSALERATMDDLQNIKNSLNSLGAECLQFIDAIRRCRGQPDKSDLVLAADKISEASSNLVKELTNIQLNLKQEVSGTEKELSNAAALIEAQFNTIEDSEGPEDKNPELDNIREACKSIADTSSSLIRVVMSCQREISKKASLSPNSTLYRGDGTNGFLSCSKQVSACTHEFFELAKTMLKGTENVDMDKLLVHAKQVNSATVQLVISASVNEVSPKAQEHLKTSAKAVKDVIDFLTKAVEEKKQEEKYIEDVKQGIIGTGQAATIKAEMEAQMTILKMESQLEFARKKLTGMRKSRYDAKKS